MLIIAITFSVGYPNYERGIYESNVSADATRLEAINIATIRYATDHNGSYPAASTLVSTTVPGTLYLPEVPASPLGAAGYAYGAAPVGGAPYVIIDSNAFGGTGQADPALLANYLRADGSACETSDMLAVDNLHGTYCAQTGD